MLKLRKTRFFRRNVAPLFDDRFQFLLWISLGSGADFLGNVRALQFGGKLWNQFGDVITRSLWLQVTFFFWNILDYRLDLVVTFLWTLNKSTTSGGAQLSRLLVTLSDGSVFGNRLLDDAAHLFGPLGAPSAGGVASRLVFTFLLQLCATLGNIILNFVWFLFGPTL